MGGLLHLIGNDELTEIRRNCDWRDLWKHIGIIKNETKSRLDDWWGLSPFTDEKTASFHMNDKGWYCQSTHYQVEGTKRPGGYVIELVQALAQFRGERLSCWQAGEWLVEQGLSRFSGSPITDNKPLCLPAHHVAPVTPPKPKQGTQKTNEPIKFSLVPFYAKRFHPHLAARSITRKTYDYLGAGFLPKDSKSPLAGRLVFQIRSIEKHAGGELRPVIVSHIGRAIGNEQTQKGGKWHFYKGFNKSLELYNFDLVLLENKAKRCVRHSKTIVLTEGCFDVATLVEGGIYNAVASFGAHLSAEQIERLHLAEQMHGKLRIVIIYDRDKAGFTGTKTAAAMLKAQGFEVAVFDWGWIEDKLISDVSELGKSDLKLLAQMLLQDRH